MVKDEADRLFPGLRRLRPRPLIGYQCVLHGMFGDFRGEDDLSQTV